jgi:Polysaccharide lyase
MQCFLTLVAGIVLFISLMFIYAHAALTGTVDFETGDLSQVRSTQGCCSYSLTITSDPVRLGSYAVKMDTRVGDPPVAGGNHRAEVLVGDSVMGEHWYGWSLYFPADWNENLPYSTGHWVNITQWHGNVGVPLQLVASGNGIGFSHNQQLTDSGLFPGTNIGTVDSMIGKWTDFVVHANWQTDSSGYFEIWMNGTKVVDWHGVTAPNNGGLNPYWKAGLYYGTNENRTIYVDEMRMGDSSSSFDEVDPAHHQPAYTGELSGAVDTPSGTQNLTSLGSEDWAHWGLTTAASFDHKDGVTQQISDYSEVGSGNKGRYSDNAIGYTWTDGTPDESSTNSTTGLFFQSSGHGWSFTVPADETERTVSVFTGVHKAKEHISASLSDSSAAAYSDESLDNSSGNSLGVHTLTYKAGEADQTLTVQGTLDTDYGTGNVTLQSAYVASTTPAPDFTIEVSPSPLGIPLNGSNSATITVSPMNNFSGDVSLSVSGLPAHVTASFAPSTITGGSGSSLMSLAADGSAAEGDTDITVTGESGTLGHDAPETLTVAGNCSAPSVPAIQCVTDGNVATCTALLQ